MILFHFSFFPISSQELTHSSERGLVSAQLHEVAITTATTSSLSLFGGNLTSTSSLHFLKQQPLPSDDSYMTTEELVTDSLEISKVWESTSSFLHILNVLLYHFIFLFLFLLIDPLSSSPPPPGPHPDSTSQAPGSHRPTAVVFLQRPGLSTASGRHVGRALTG